MMRFVSVALLGIMIVAILSDVTRSDMPPPGDATRSWKSATRLAGKASRDGRGAAAFQLPIKGLNAKDLTRFFAGQNLFETSWVVAPSPVTDLDGLGPTYNRVSCGGCHQRNGRGSVPANPSAPLFTATVRVSTATGKDHPHYGRQINNFSIPGVEAEARIRLSWQITHGRYGDGTPYQLRRPTIRLINPRFGPLRKRDRRSLRIAPALVGLGLLAAVDERAILAHADPDDRNGDGISGRAHWIQLPKQKGTQKKQLGRFGWKAGEASLRSQNARAALTDMGLTSTLFPQENCPLVQRECAAQPSGGTPELDDKALSDLTFYTAALSVPTRRNPTAPLVRRGADLFATMGCTSCHRPVLRTAKTGVPDWAQNLTLHAFTDLLLHDMGPGLSDGFSDGDARAGEWRTPPLWGLGRMRQVSGQPVYLHDGRAQSLAAAILWHGGEGKAAREQFRLAQKADRDALIAFLKSL